MASQSKIIACGKRMAAVTLALRFLLSPGLMALSSYIFGLRGTPLNVAIVQVMKAAMDIFSVIKT